MSNDNHARRKPHMRLPAVLGAAALAVLLSLAGCSASDGGTSESSGVTQREADAAAPGVEAPGAAAPDVEAPDVEAPGGTDDRDGAGRKEEQGAGTPVDLRVDQRAVIYAGSVSVRVDDVAARAAEATSIATAAGGYVGRDERSEDDTWTRASLELRVPAATFASVVDRIAGLGEEERRDLSAQDVTEETLDLDARIATQQALVNSGRRLLAQADSLADLVMLESELARREADLASLEAKKRHLADLAALSRITVELLGPDAPSPTEEPTTGFLAGLSHGWNAFVTSVRIVLTVVGVLLPWILLLGLPTLGGIWLVRRLNRGSRREPAPAVAAPAPAAAAPATAERATADLPAPTE